MQDWWSQATQLAWAGANGGAYIGKPYRGVLHTAESDATTYRPSRTDYFGHKNPPHFTLCLENGAPKVYQHFPLSVASRALENLTGEKLRERLPHGQDVQTNRANAIQIEICWWADKIATLPAPMFALLKQWMRWVERETGVQRLAPDVFYGSNGGYGYTARSRMDAAQWYAFNGWCGHQHVPENSHWDPGPIDIRTLLAVP